jgi:hypothetical protein
MGRKNGQIQQQIVIPGSWFRASATTTMNKSSDRPKLEDTTNPMTDGDWRLYVQN